MQELVQGIVDDVNARPLALRADQALRHPPARLLAEEGEITPTLKLKRRVVREHFADEIERSTPPE